MIDQYGRQIWQGDTVVLKGSIVDLLEGQQNYINCTVLLDQQLPPSGTQVYVDLNSQQLIKQGPGQPPYYRPLPVTYSRLEAERSSRRACMLRIYMDLGEVKQMIKMLEYLRNLQQ